jgi:hypothetical protein
LSNQRALRSREQHGAFGAAQQAQNFLPLSNSCYCPQKYGSNISIAPRATWRWHLRHQFDPKPVADGLGTAVEPLNFRDAA